MSDDLVDVVFVECVPVPLSHFRRSRWHDRLRGWLIEALGGDDPNKVQTFRRIQFRSRDFMTLLLAQHREIADQFRMRPERMLIGAENFEELMRMTNVQHYFSFDAKYNMGQRFYGLAVTVVPWMRGIVLLPK